MKRRNFRGHNRALGVGERNEKLDFNGKYRAV